jgi:hypothetical protein
MTLSLKDPARWSIMDPNTPILIAVLGNPLVGPNSGAISYEWRLDRLAYGTVVLAAGIRKTLRGGYN